MRKPCHILWISVLLSGFAHAQTESRWEAASGLRPDQAVPAYELWLGGALPTGCALPTGTLTGSEFVLDTSGCDEATAFIAQILPEPTDGPRPATHWIELDLRVPGSAPGSGAFCEIDLRFEDFPCWWTFIVSGQGIGGIFFGSNSPSLGQASIDMASTFRRVRIEIDRVPRDGRVLVDGQLAFSWTAATPISNCASSLPQSLLRIGDLSDQFGGTIELRSIAHNFVPYALAYCRPPAPNSTGGRATMSWTGSRAIAADDFQLATAGVPATSFGYYLCSLAAAPPLSPMGSQGALCLGGAIGRFNRAGEILQASAAGTVGLHVPLTALPQPSGSVAAQPGDTWHFQLWYRDANPGPTSSLSEALRVTLE